MSNRDLSVIRNVSATTNTVSSSGKPGSSTDAGTADPSVSYWTLIRNSPFTHQAFVGIVCLQCLCNLIERIWLFSQADFNSEVAFRQALYFFLVILASIVFVGYFAIHSVLQANPFEMAAFFFASVMLLIRLAIEYINLSDECLGPNSAICAGFLAVSCFFVTVAMAFTCTMYRDLQWKRYKAIGAEINTLKMYKLFEVFSAVRKLDMQFSSVTLVTGLVFFINADSGSFDEIALGINIGLFVIELVWERIGIYAIRNEHRYLLYLFWILSFGLPAFIIFILIDSLTGNKLLLEFAVEESVRITIGVMAILSVLNRIVTVVCSVLLFVNFGPNYVGLRRIIVSNRRSKFNRSRQTQYIENTNTTINSTNLSSSSSSSSNSGSSLRDLKSSTTNSTGRKPTTKDENTTNTVIAINPVDTALNNLSTNGPVQEWSATGSVSSTVAPPIDVPSSSASSARALRVNSLSKNRDGFT